jgi:hypothetical protein
MKYVITENRLVDFVGNYLEDSVGRLRKFPLNSINAGEDDFELVDDGGNTIFSYYDYGLGIDKTIFYKMMSLFNLEGRELENLLESWFEKNYPGNMVLSAYPNIS